MNAQLHHGDCRDVLATLPAESIDAVVCDPPYGLAFMGKAWDHGVPSADVWRAVLRVLKPGGHLLAFGGTRTYHRMACAIEDAGFEIRDQIGWVYGSGFPKSLDVSKAIDKAAGAQREVVSERETGWSGTLGGKAALGGLGGAVDVRRVTAPATDAAREWSGWGTALKPAWEPIVLARKPLAGTVAANVQAHGTGALNIDGCRVGGEPSPSAAMRASGVAPSSCRPGEYGDGHAIQNRVSPERWLEPRPGEALGRWPANLIHDGSDEVVALFPDAPGQSGDVRGTEPSGVTNGIYGKFSGRVASAARGDAGSAARFFYCAKASRADRDDGCDALRKRPLRWSSGEANPGSFQSPGTDKSARNHHPTVKPTDLMRYLCRLITPPGGVVLDPFMGSGSTGRGALLEGFRFVGIEREPDYFAIAQARIRAVPQQIDMFGRPSLIEKDGAA